MYDDYNNQINQIPDWVFLDPKFLCASQYHQKYTHVTRCLLQRKQGKMSTNNRSTMNEIRESQRSSMNCQYLPSTEPLNQTIRSLIPITKRLVVQPARCVFTNAADEEVASCCVADHCCCPDLPVCDGEVFSVSSRWWGNVLLPDLV